MFKAGQKAQPLSLQRAAVSGYPGARRATCRSQGLQTQIERSCFAELWSPPKKSHPHRSLQRKSKTKPKKTTPRFGRGVMARNVGELRKEKRRKASQNPEIHTLLVNTRLLRASRCEVMPCFIQG